MAGFPILFLDIDGPLLPFGDGVPGTPGIARLDPRHGLTDAGYLELDAWLRAARP